jgi:hypothetical protein
MVSESNNTCGGELKRHLSNGYNVGGRLWCWSIMVMVSESNNACDGELKRHLSNGYNVGA